ncbi:putative alkaline serine protease AorO [Xylogone sp. PMI_703]|nr:putative alkaline serine protease AorO [Xylogone sp. PMI_703]
MKYNNFLLLGFIARAVASQVTVSHVVHEKRDIASGEQSQWQKLETLSSNMTIPVRMALKQRNQDRGMKLLMEVSDPRSKSYGKHYKPEEVVELFAPDDESVETVRRWLISAGISNKTIVVPKSKGWVHFDATVAQLESALSTKYYRYEHIKSHRNYIGADIYHLPSDVSTIVDFVIPAVAMARDKGSSDEMKKRGDNAVKRIQSSSLSDNSTDNVCANSVTPACVKALYNITENTLHNPKNHIGVYESNDQKYSQEDLNQFYKLYAPNIPQGWAPIVDSIDNATAPTGPGEEAGGEANLDLMMIIPIVYPHKVKVYQTQVNSLFGLFNNFLDAIDGSYCTYSAYGETGDDPDIDGVTPNEDCGTFKPAPVISISYSFAEISYPASYSKRQCDEFMKLGLMGTTLVFASGDAGVAENGCIGTDFTIFTPDDMSSCPYVLSVGGSTLPPNLQPGDPETAPMTFTPGGGFSNVYLAPDYQKDTIESYFKNHDPHVPFYTTKDGVIPETGGSFNRAGRGYPDIAAASENGVTVLQGKVVSDNLGTSMSAPIVAGILSRINEERLKSGKSFIGFVNPVFYAHPEMFNDVTFRALVGGACINESFTAVKGWDPITGLGTPNYPAMLEVFMNLD